MSAKWAAIGAATISVASAGLGAYGLYLWNKNHGPVPEVVAPAPEIRQPDDSVILERKPNPKPKPPPHRIPKGSKEERRVELTVAPKTPGCPPVRASISIVKEGEGRRVIASSPDGLILDAVDMPIEPVLIARKPKSWAAGVSYGLSDESVGLWVDRDLGKRFVVGADLYDNNERGIEARVRIGVRF